MEDMLKTSWVPLALRARCPRCGQGSLFDGWLKIADKCSNCGLDFSKADPGDGPAVFVMFVVGFVVVVLGFWLQMSFHLPTWALLLVLGIVTLGLSVYLLRPFKAALIVLQFRNEAREGRLSE